MPGPALKRSISLPLLIFYGLGTILGAGIYALVGKVAGESLGYAPLAFLIAGIVATFTALSYGELSARLPKSAGEVTYVQTALKRKKLSILVGLLVVFTGIVSIATLANGFSGYLKQFIPIQNWQTICILITGFGLIAIWGIKQSVILATIITILEAVGLIIIIAICRESLFELPIRWPELIPSFTPDAWKGIFLGAFMAFFAFIGFEDMVNVAEEVKNPKRNLPLAIIISLIIVTILYLLTASAATLSLPLEQLAESDAPLTLVAEQKNSNYGPIITIISLIAISNGVLVQIIMASRVLYGMANQKLAPQKFSKINFKTRTPILATITVIAIALVLALWFPITNLANATSFIILSVFVLVNLSLWVLKSKKTHPANIPKYPLFIPITGFFLSLGFLVLKTILTI
ncbi:amino acid permease [Candidatus Peregrinibacteria bacterium]|nr:amino acid permease [Candidatus Peregrinibacteria bacterium]